MLLSVVVPAYNEQEVIYDNLKTICQSIERFTLDYEVIVVDDGSTDGTAQETARAINDDQDRVRKETAPDKDSYISLHSFSANRGKGAAVMEGVSLAWGDYIAFLDADLDLSPDYLEDFLDTAVKTKAAAVIGSKLHKDSRVDYPPARRAFSLCYYWLVKALFRLDIKDTQTGIKLFSRQALQEVRDWVQTRGYAFDIELLALLAADGGLIVERPIELDFKRGKGWGRIRLGAILRMFTDTFRAKKRVKEYKKARRIK